MDTNKIFTNKLVSSLFILVAGAVLMVGTFTAMIYFYYIILKFDDPVAKTRVALNVAIIAFSYLILAFVSYRFYKSRLSDLAKATLMPALLTANIELVMNIVLATGLNVPIFQLDALAIFGLAGLMAMKKAPYQYFVGLACVAFWHIGFVLMMGG